MRICHTREVQAVDELIHFFGVLLRFPFFLIRVILWTPFILMVFVLGNIFSVIGIPFKFIEAAWKNEKSILESWIKDIFKFEGFWKGYR